MKTRKFCGMCGFFLVVGGLATLFALLRENLVLAPYRFMEDQGRLGAVYFTIFMAAWIICGFPSTIIEVLAGFMYGFGWGFLIGFVGKQIASTISFTLARRFAQKCTERLQKRFFMLRAMDTALRDSPRRILFLVCIAYIPASVKNYGLALFKCVSFAMFFFAIAVTGIPYTVMSTWIGATSYSIIEVVQQQTDPEATDTDDGQGTQAVSALKMAMMIIGGVSSVILLLVLGVYGRRARRELIERADIEDAAALEAAEEEIAAVAEGEERAELESIRICGPRDDTYVQSNAQPSRKLRRTQSDSKLSVHSRSSLNLLKFAQHHVLGVKLKPLAASDMPLTPERRVSTLCSVPTDRPSFGSRLLSPKHSAETHRTQPKTTQTFAFPEPISPPRKMTFFEMLEQDLSDEEVMPTTPGKVKNLTQMFEAKSNSKSKSPKATKSPRSAAGIRLNFSFASKTQIKSPRTSGRTPKCVLEQRAPRPRDRIHWLPPKRFQEDPKLKRHATLPQLAVSTSLPSDRIFLPPRAPLPQSKNSPHIPSGGSRTHSQHCRSGKSIPPSASPVAGVTHKYGSSLTKLHAKHSTTQAHLERQRQYRYLAKMFVGSSGIASRSATTYRRASIM